MVRATSLLLFGAAVMALLFGIFLAIPSLGSAPYFPMGITLVGTSILLAFSATGLLRERGRLRPTLLAGVVGAVCWLLLKWSLDASKEVRLDAWTHTFTVVIIGGVGSTFLFALYASGLASATHGRRMAALLSGFTVLLCLILVSRSFS